MEVNQPYKDRSVNVQVESIVKTVQSIAKLPEEILESHSRGDTLRGQKVKCMQTSYGKLGMNAEYANLDMELYLRLDALLNLCLTKKKSEWQSRLRIVSKALTDAGFPTEEVELISTLYVALGNNRFLAIPQVFLY